MEDGRVGFAQADVGGVDVDVELGVHVQPELLADQVILTGKGIGQQPNLVAISQSTGGGDHLRVEPIAGVELPHEVTCRLRVGETQTVGDVLHELVVGDRADLQLTPHFPPQHLRQRTGFQHQPPLPLGDVRLVRQSLHHAAPVEDDGAHVGQWGKGRAGNGHTQVLQPLTQRRKATEAHRVQPDLPGHRHVHPKIVHEDRLFRLNTQPPQCQFEDGGVGLDQPLAAGDDDDVESVSDALLFQALTQSCRSVAEQSGAIALIAQVADESHQFPVQPVTSPEGPPELRQFSDAQPQPPAHVGPELGAADAAQLDVVPARVAKHRLARAPRRQPEPLLQFAARKRIDRAHQHTAEVEDERANLAICHLHICHYSITPSR